jgi:hypothetical protein
MHVVSSVFVLNSAREYESDYGTRLSVCPDLLAAEIELDFRPKWTLSGDFTRGLMYLGNR